MAGNDAAFGTGPLTINGGALAADGTHTVNNAVTVGGSFMLSGAGTSNLTLTSNLALGANNLDNLGSGTNTLSGNISGNGIIAQHSDGTLILSGGNTYTGSTHLDHGTLVAGSNNALGTGALRINGGTTLAASGAARTLANTAGVLGDFTLGTGVAATNQNLYLTGAVTLENLYPHHHGKQYDGNHRAPLQRRQFRDHQGRPGHPDPVRGQHL